MQEGKGNFFERIPCFEGKFYFGEVQVIIENV